MRVIPLLLVRNFASALEDLAPLELAEEWDNVGLLVGRFRQEVNGVLLALDLTSEVIDEALKMQANLIITHHPPIFKPLKNLRLDQPRGRLWEKLIKNNLSVYTLHTNYDRSATGMNHYLAGLFGLTKPIPIEEGETYLKLVVFMPKGYEDVVMEALTAAGAGWIGNYSHCTFQTDGIGTFLPQEGTNPFLGKKGKLERAAEVRLETILPSRLQEKITRALLAIHPYEEVAYDLYPLAQNTGPTGLGRIGALPSELKWGEMVSRVKQVFSSPHLRSGGFKRNTVKKIAILGGSGGKYLVRAKALGAELMITADLGYHDYMLGKEIDLTLVDPGHQIMETKGLDQIRSYLEQSLTGAGFPLFVSKTQIDPIFSE